MRLCNALMLHLLNVSSFTRLSDSLNFWNRILLSRLQKNLVCQLPESDGYIDKSCGLDNHWHKPVQIIVRVECCAEYRHCSTKQEASSGAQGRGAGWPAFWRWVVKPVFK